MSDVSAVDQVIGNFRKELIQNYEAELKRRQEQSARAAKAFQRREEATREAMRMAHIDVDRLDRQEKEEEAALQEYLREVRPKLLERPSHHNESARRLSLQSSLHFSGRQTAPVHSTTLLASDAAFLEGNPGERGNPWVQPWNPGEINLKDSSTGSGSGCWAQAATPTASAVVWFAFIPDKTANWNLVPLIDFFGFYIIRANDSWYDCKSARLDASVDVSAYQYWWRPTKHFSVLHKDDDNIDESNLFNEYGWFDYAAPLRAGDWAFVKATITLDASARGGGSYGELNFSDGNNKILPLILLAWPS